MSRLKCASSRFVCYRARLYNYEYPGAFDGREVSLLSAVHSGSETLEPEAVLLAAVSVRGKILLLADGLSTHRKHVYISN